MKYEITDELVQVSGSLLYRIKALRDIPRYDVNAGDYGGYIEGARNLSQEGDCWVDQMGSVRNHAQVLDDALVSGSAEIHHYAQVSGEARVEGRAMVKGSAHVRGGAVVSDASYIGDHAVIEGCARILGNSAVDGRAFVGGHASIVYAVVSDRARATDHVNVRGSSFHRARISDHAQVSGHATLRGSVTVAEEARVYGKADVSGTARIVDWAVVCDNAVVQDQAVIKGHAQVRDQAKVGGTSRISGYAKIVDKAQAWGHTVAGDRVVLCGRGQVHDATLCGHVVFSRTQNSGKISGKGVYDSAHRWVAKYCGPEEYRRMLPMIHNVSFRDVRSVSYSDQYVVLCCEPSSVEWLRAKFRMPESRVLLYPDVEDTYMVIALQDLYQVLCRPCKVRS